MDSDAASVFLSTTPALELPPVVPSVPTTGGNTAPGPMAPSDPVPSVPDTPRGPVRKGKSFNPAKFWCFTAFAPAGQDIEEYGNMIFKKLDRLTKRYAGQVEKCASTGRHHIQGALEAKAKLRPSVFGLPISIHWEVCQGSWSSNLEYCTKKETKDGKLWLKGCAIEEEIEVMADEELSVWMIDLLQIFENKADKRTIHWYWSEEGGVGKSSFAK
jgi:hypothetical protein